MSRKPRRISTPPPAGSDPHPADGGAELAGEDRPESWGDAREQQSERDNDQRLRDNVPPHSVHT